MTTSATSAKRETFRLAVSTALSIAAPPSRLWNLLVDLEAQSRWNSTVTSITGQAALGRRVTFEIPEAPGQKFSPTVTSFDEPRSMVWRLNRWPLLVSERTYRLTPMRDGSTEFGMSEVFEGLLLPLAARTFPDFGRMLERTALDLRAAALQSG